MAEDTDDCCEETSHSQDSIDGPKMLFSYLNEVEKNVESLKTKSLMLAQEKESLLTVLQHLKDEAETTLGSDDCADYKTNIERLQQRCHTVHISITTLRNPVQEEALSRVESLVSKLEHMCLAGDEGQEDSGGYHTKARSYLNACLSDGPQNGCVDYKFQGIVLDCAIEDQKSIRQRLESLVQGKCHISILDDVENSFVFCNSSLNSSTATNCDEQENGAS